MEHLNIVYDKPIEVTEKQYKKLMTSFSGIVAGRIEGGKYFIKVWLMSYVHHIEKFLTTN